MYVNYMLIIFFLSAIGLNKNLIAKIIFAESFRNPRKCDLWNPLAPYSHPVGDAALQSSLPRN